MRIRYARLPRLESLLGAIYPPQCALCDALVVQAGGLCGPCWAGTSFLTGLVCDLCGTPLPGDDPGHPAHCDDCLAIARGWDRGRAALAYRDGGRRFVLALKHGDRLDLVPLGAVWLRRAAGPLLRPGQVAVPVPAHWRRLVGRRYNQAAELARALARSTGMRAEMRALVRIRRTRVQEGMSRDERFANMCDAIRPHPRFGDRLRGRDVLLVDDVITSGATLAAAAEAAREAGAAHVAVAALARAVKAT